MARKKPEAKPPVDAETINRSLAHVVATGDMVNLRFLFVPFSPLRDDSTERIDTPKYAYLRPEDERDAAYQDALALVRTPSIQEHVRAQLVKKGPAQLPWELVLRLADNAVRLEKYSAAAQAYELLRIRERMREEFLREADAALGQRDFSRAVRGYAIAAGLSYDYAAFPEPLPMTPGYQARALLLHAEYPRQPADAVALQPPEAHLQIALEYLLIDPELAARIAPRSNADKVAFAVEYVRQLDPAWPEFSARYRRACEIVREIGARIEREAQGNGKLADEIAAQQDAVNPRSIPDALLGRPMENGEWWQYLKELAYQHPAAVLFVSRQAVSQDLEIIMPRYVTGSELVARLGLEAA